jgi:esterase/lipase superfamily enzyme
MAVLYITDRVPTKETPDHWEYGKERSRSAAFGEATVKIGENETWEQIVEASRSAKRKEKLELTITSTNELGRFGPTPPKLFLSDAEMAHAQATAALENTEVSRRFHDELKARLAQTPRKEVFMYIHGFANTFNNAIDTTADLWHFLGREGVPIAYTWPAGTGAVRGYMYTMLSGQFTNYHLKQTLRLIASCPEVQKIHIIAHSRGTDVATTAVRELYLEALNTPGATEKLKLGTCALAAADMDLDVAIELNVTERVGRAVEALALYICDSDKALAFSNWLSLGQMRLGDVDPKVFTPDEMSALRAQHKLQIVDARVKKLGFISHSYFHDNPAVSSDLVLYLRYGLQPGAANGRPLVEAPSGFWLIETGYPGENWRLPASAEGK